METIHGLKKKIAVPSVALERSAEERKKMEQIQTDLISREKIIHNINHNYFVEAGAGSGKTTVLVKRIVSMIEQGIDISRICAITFTKAAANEFY